jgi:hypothetical protein
MGDHFHFHIPGWKRILMKMGVVDGTREICRALLEDKYAEFLHALSGGSSHSTCWCCGCFLSEISHHSCSHPVLIYPGGAREAFKKKSDPKYALFWAGTAFAPTSLARFATLIYSLGHQTTRALPEWRYRRKPSSCR